MNSGAPPFGVSQYTTWPQSFERDLELYLEAGVRFIEVCEAKLDPADPDRQLERLKETGLVVSSVQPRLHSLFSDLPRPEPKSPRERMRRFDGLVNNAADMTRGSLESTDVASFDRTIAINLRAPFLTIKAALPHFRRQGGGRVLNIGSLNSYCGQRDLLGYSISKGGLLTMTRNLADAHGREGIRINHFNVGWTLTPNEYELKKKEGLPEDWPSRVPPVHAPSGRLLSPEDIAWAAVYFLSDEAPLVNGSILDVEQYPVIGRNPVKGI